jgi:iron complex transport system substrate-binding protein
MRIAALEPDLAEVVCSLGLAEQVVAVCSGCDHPALVNAARVTVPRAAPSEVLEDLLCAERVDLVSLKAAAPDIVLGRVTGGQDSETLAGQVLALLKDELGEGVQLYSSSPTTLDGVFSVLEELGKQLGAGPRGRELASRTKAQFMDWCDNFYDRMKNKKVTFLSSLEPLRLAGFWVPDMIELASAASQAVASGDGDVAVSWEEVVAFRPDVIVVAPRAMSLTECIKTFPAFEKRPAWEDIPAVKRGEVIFTDGIHHFYHASLDLIEAMAILISAIAGFDSGYITKRDSFYRLRWLELQRHRI